MKFFALYFAIAVGLVAEQCHGLYYKTRSTWNASPPKTPPRPFTVPATLVVLRPTGTSECNVGSCARIVKEIQNDDMKNKGLDDIGSNFVVGGCTGIFPGSGWEGISPMAEKDPQPSVHITVAGRFEDATVPSNVANTLKGLIDDGIKKGKIDSGFKIRCSYRDNKCPVEFKNTILTTMTGNTFDSYEDTFIEPQ